MSMDFLVGFSSNDAFVASGKKTYPVDNLRSLPNTPNKN